MWVRTVLASSFLSLSFSSDPLAPPILSLYRLISIWRCGANVALAERSPFREDMQRNPVFCINSSSTSIIGKVWTQRQTFWDTIYLLAIELTYA